MVEIPDAAVEAGGRVLHTDFGYKTRDDAARAVLEAATVEIRCPLVPAVPAELHVHCGACNGIGTLRVLRTGEPK